MAADGIGNTGDQLLSRSHDGDQSVMTRLQVFPAHYQTQDHHGGDVNSAGQRGQQADMQGARGPDQQRILNLEFFKKSRQDALGA